MGKKIEEEFKLYIREKLKDKPFKYMCYASNSFEKQRNAIHQLCADMNKDFPKTYHDKNFRIAKYIICGWADDLTRLFSLCLPDFMDRFGKGISVGKIKEITEKELFNHAKTN